tara:strand:+ start:156 stop:509 length:354 start_codon:yes stop_codon:yes gene_type:complete
MSWKDILKNEMAENTEEDDSYYWQGAFSKFGFGDGWDSDYSYEVLKFLEGKGYEVGMGVTGGHNDYIEIIHKDGKEVFKNDRKSNSVERDLPSEITDLLDAQFPNGYFKPTSGSDRD